MCLSFEISKMAYPAIRFGRNAHGVSQSARRKWRLRIFISFLAQNSLKEFTEIWFVGRELSQRSG